MTGPELLLIGDNPVQLARRKKPGKVAIDTETTGLDYTDRVLGISLAWRTTSGGKNIRSCYLHAMGAGQMHLEELSLKKLDNSDDVLKLLWQNKEMVFHNEAFDLRVLGKHWGLGVPGRSHDTMHISSLVGWQENRTLDGLYGRYVPNKSLPEWYTKTKDKRHSLSKMSSEAVARYARQDAVCTLLLEEQLAKQLRPSENNHIYEQDRRFSKTVMEMMLRGIKLDYDWAHKKRVTWNDRRVEIERYLLSRGLMAISSNESVAAYLYKVLDLPVTGLPTKKKNSAFPGGVPSVAADELSKVAHMHDDVKLIVEHRQLSKAQSSWIDTSIKEASIDGMVHSILQPWGTKSFRMSSSRFNLQAIPYKDRDKAFGSMRGMFIGDNSDEELWALDLKQAEVRMAAVESMDSELSKSLAEEDPYVAMAEYVWDDPSKRDQAKRAVLASIYEVGPDTFAKDNDIDYSMAQQTLDDFRSGFPRLRSRSRMMMSMVKQRRAIRLWTKRMVYFGPEEVNPSYKAFNQIVQGGTAELIDDAMVKIDDAMPGRLKLQIHDSVILSLPKKKKEQKQLLNFAAAAMSSALPRHIADNVHPPVPFPVDTEIWQ